MDKHRQEDLIDKLLVFAKDEVESQGALIKEISFDFSESQEDAVNFLKRNTEITLDDMTVVLNVCISRGYLKRRTIGRRYRYLHLTEMGQGRATSVDAAKLVPITAQQNSSRITIGTLNTRGATQIGNHNIQNIEHVLTSIIEQIENAEAPEKDKQEAKSRLKAFLEHPLTSVALGTSIQAVLAALGGGG